MIKIINNEDPISLRLLNWFAMKHSATMESLEIINESGERELFDVKISYRARLNTHSKKYFDPFRRGKRFDYHYDRTNQDKTVETTLCQLNFFRWLFLHDLMDYVDDQFDALKYRMGTYNNVEKKKKETKKENWQEPASVLDKVREEAEELEQAVASGETSQVREELGDLLFSVAQFARHCGIDPEAALREAGAKFERRFGAMEVRASSEGRSLAGLPAEELEALWLAAKRDTR